MQVWDTIDRKPNLEHTIYTIASVGHVKWRPQKTYVEKKKLKIFSLYCFYDLPLHL